MFGTHLGFKGSNKGLNWSIVPKFKHRQLQPYSYRLPKFERSPRCTFILRHSNFGSRFLTEHYCRIHTILSPTNLLWFTRPQHKITFGRDWRHYSKDKLNAYLACVDWTNNDVNVQQMWDDFESKLINVVDFLAPILEFRDGELRVDLAPLIKRKLNLRNRLLKQLKRLPTLVLKTRVKNLNLEIRN